MIQSKEDYLFYLEADRVALGRPIRTFKTRLRNLVFPDPVWKFQRTLRKLEFYKNCKRGIFYKVFTIFISRKFQKLSVKLGFSIPINVFGPGLSIAHYGTIIINTGARIGENCRIHADVNIGTAAGYKDKAPQLGNNIYIGPGAKIYGDIKLGNNIAISANAVVNQSFENDGVVLAGIPAQEVGKTDVNNLLIHATSIVKQGKHKLNLEGLTSREVKKIITGDE